jgi:hypothetical protein
MNNNIIKKIELSKLLQLVNIIKKDIKDFYAFIQLNNPHKGDFTEFHRKLNEINANINLLKTQMVNLSDNNSDNDNKDKNILNMDSAVQWDCEKNKAENIYIDNGMKDECGDNNDDEEDEDMSTYVLKDELKNSVYEVIKINDALSNFVNKSMNYNQQTISFIVNLFNKDYSCDYNKNASYNKNLKRSVCLVKDIQI